MDEGVTAARAVAQLVPVDDGTLPGSAFAIAPQLALTAYHCVGRRTGSRVALRFAGGETVTASSISGDDDGDIALLALDHAIPDWLQPVALVAATAVPDGARFLAEGFGVDRPPGSAPHAIDGNVVRAQARLFDRLVPALQLSSPQLAAGEDPHQFSGGPVLVDVGQKARPPGYAAVGVVRWAHVRDETPEKAIGGVFYATPVARAAQQWRQVADLISPGVVSTGTAQVRLEGEHGSALDEIPLRARPRIRARRRPVVVRPAAFPRHLDRSEESARLLESTASERTLNMCGEAGIGKTYVLVAVANGDGWRKGAGSVVYVMARGMQVGDVLQKVFEELYVCEPETRLPEAQVKRLLGRRAALVLVDSADLSSEQARELIQALGADYRVVVASRERILWDGPALALGGLSAQDGVAVVEQELGHALDPDDRSTAEQISAALHGHPLHIRQAVALVAERRTDLATIACQLTAAGNAVAPMMELIEGSIQAVSPAQRRVLAALSLLDGVTLGTDRLAELAGVPDVQGLLEPLERLGLLRRHSPRWSATPTLTSELLEPLRGWRDEARSDLVDSLLSWAEAHRATPTELSDELPALLAALRLAHHNEMLPQTVRLGRVIEPALILSRRWDAWEEALLNVRDASERLGDPAAKAWALHELGTRLVAIGERRDGIATLREAQHLRAELGDKRGEALTTHNLTVAAKPVPLLNRLLARWLPTVSLSVIAAAVIAVIVASGVGAALAIANGSGGRSSNSGPTGAPPTTTATSTPSTTTATSTPSTATANPKSVAGAKITPPSLDFGRHEAGSKTVKTVMLFNSGKAPLTVSSVKLTGTNAGDFAKSSDGCSGQSVPAGSSCTVQVTFTPGESGARSATLVFNDNASNSPQNVGLSGGGVAAPAASVRPSLVDFGSHEAGSKTVKTVMLFNSGNAPLTVSSVKLTGTNAGDFAKSSDGCSGQSVPAGSSCTVQVTFTPGESGARSATLVFNDNASDSPQQISLSGSGLTTSRLSRFCGWLGCEGRGGGGMLGMGLLVV